MAKYVATNTSGIVAIRKLEDLVLLPYSGKYSGYGTDTKDAGRGFGFNKKFGREQGLPAYGGNSCKKYPVHTLDRMLKRTSTAWPLPIRSITTGNKDVQTYDIEVKGINQFTAEGIVVHNSALLAYGNLEDKEFINLKNWEQFPERNGPDGWSFMSNNSVKANVNSDLSGIADGIALNGEPGVIWEDVVKTRGRLIDPPDDKDSNFACFNPCFAGDTLIATKDGSRRIDSLTTPFIAIVKGEEYKATASWLNGIKPTYRLITEEGHELVITHDHKIMTPSGDWKEAGELSVGQEISTHIDPFVAHVKSFEYESDQSVYDLTVEDVHAMDANGLYASNCAEQPLFSYEACNLVDVYVDRHESLEDFKRTLKFAFMYGKTVTLLPTHFPETNAVMQRNRRIGLSLSGCANFIDNRTNGLQELRKWFDEGYNTVRHYDKNYSEWLCVRESNRVTTIKPGGTTGVLCSTSSGIHWTDGGEYFMRTLRMGENDPLLPYLRESGHKIEPDQMDPDNSVVIYFPIHSNARRSARDVSLFEKAALAVEAQRLWSDNGVSVTLTFDAEKEKEHVSTILNMYSGQLKAVSFLPTGNTIYPQQPFTSMTQEEFEAETFKLMPARLEDMYAGMGLNIAQEEYCETDICIIKNNKLELEDFIARGE